MGTELDLQTPNAESSPAASAPVISTADAAGVSLSSDSPGGGSPGGTFGASLPAGVPGPATSMSGAASEAKAAAFSTPQLIGAMLKGRGHVSDLIFSPGHAPQVELNGELVELKFRGLERLKPLHTAQIAQELMGSNEHHGASVREGRLGGPVLFGAGGGAFSREYFSPARDARHRDARDPGQGTYFR